MALSLKNVLASKPNTKNSTRRAVVMRAGKYDAELVVTAKTLASPGRGLLAMDESNATCGKRLDSVGLENNLTNRRAYRTLLVNTPGLNKYISGAILFEETLFDTTECGKKFVDVFKSAGIIPGIKVDKGLAPIANFSGETWAMGLEGLDKRCA
eukprot:CAMPEP_0175045552 /NCGR_PEP_ID=MMETSP0052_2-20121109/4495_1 /TAXON_ID=51329 ORGANISM="Polytomella parva, Strain SAG 63-3" /NCGR_SAMPLE_ID=MMETSP0052_2 /ASSEMBLY_ACC=CAM_ASM_000194 /LENGTH=153 /DNA_ID=CAMNT_0016309113 /DNA_START=24 /DNA_END=481 /DNA_ORIENTATION=-